jgi:hypothetical protein
MPALRLASSPSSLLLMGTGTGLASPLVVMLGGVRHLIGNPAHVPDSQLWGAVLTSAS